MCAASCGIACSHIILCGTVCPSFVVPFARYELGVATKDARMLNRARDYKNDFNFKIRLHARVHLALDDLARRSKGGQ